MNPNPKEFVSAQEVLDALMTEAKEQCPTPDLKDWALCSAAGYLSEMIRGDKVKFKLMLLRYREETK